MRNGQLKPGYNVQIAVNSEYITGLEVFSDRSDAKTFRPMMRKLAEKHGKHYEESVADAGYEQRDVHPDRTPLHTGRRLAIEAPLRLRKRELRGETRPDRKHGLLS